MESQPTKTEAEEGHMSQFKEISPERDKEIRARVAELDEQITNIDKRTNQHFQPVAERARLLSELFGCQ
jgi:hypothetical protein